MKHRLVGFCLIVAFVALIGDATWAQVSSASISGRVEDASGASIPGAKVTVTDVETGAVRSVTAEEGGNYRILSLPVGHYELKAEKVGFKSALQTGINLVVGQEAAIELKLEIGQMEQSVTVTADVPLINTTTSSVSGLVGEEQIKQLPLNGRSFDLLITINPGTVNLSPNRSATNPSGGGNFLSVVGRRSVENVILMNGVEYNGAGNTANTPGGASGELLGIEAIREYNVVSDTYGAEYGKRPGGQISLVTQSGTNQLHGTLFEFLRNNVLDARNYFSRADQPFKRNQFGAAAGGPIKKNKTFVFGNYEGLRQRLQAAFVSFVPDANMRKGLLPNAAGVPTPVAGLDPRVLPYLNFWPQPNGPVLGGGIAEAFSNAPTPIQQDFGTVRVDQTISNKDSLSVSYLVDDSSNSLPNADPTTGNHEIIRNQVLSIQETHVFSPNVINSFTQGYSRAKYTNTPYNAPGTPDLSLVQGYLMGQIGIGGNTNQSAGLDLIGNLSPLVFFIHNLFTTADTLQVIRGKHQLSFGGWYQRVQQNDADPLRVQGSLNFPTVTALLQAKPSIFQVAPNDVEYGWRNWAGAWFAQDSIQLRKNLTVRVGLRHEFANVWTEVNGKAAAETFVNGVIQTLPRISDTFNTANNSKWLFSPRVGLAWDVFGNGKTSVRSGFGIYYNMMDWLIYWVDTTPPLTGVIAFNNPVMFPLIPYDPKTPVLPPCSPGVPTSQCSIYQPKDIQSDYKIPTVNEWNLSIEQQLAQSTALRVAYVGSNNYHNWLGSDPNRIPPQICNNAAGCLAGGVGTARSTVPQGTFYVPVGQRPNPFLGSGFFGYTRGYGNYNALEVEVNQRLTKGLQFRANYTWSKNLDVASSVSSGVGGTGAGGDVLHLNFPDLRGDYGLATFSLTHQAGGNFSYALPFGKGKTFLGNTQGLTDKLVGGWQLNGIVTAISGFPMTIAAGGNPSGDGDSNGADRPNWAPGFKGNPTHGVTAGCGGGIIPAGQPLHTPTRWFDPCAFTLPAAGTFGNVGRDSVIGPPLVTLNMSLFKDTRISERLNTQFRFETFNLFNHPNFRIPQNGNPAVFSGTSYISGSGVIQSTATDQREIQVALKLMF